MASKPNNFGFSFLRGVRKIHLRDKINLFVKSVMEVHFLMLSLFLLCIN